MSNTTHHTQRERKKRISRARVMGGDYSKTNAAPYPHRGQFAQGAREVLADEAIDYSKTKPLGKGPKGWRRSIGDGESLSHGKNGWLASVRPDRPGTVMCSLVRYFEARNAAVDFMGQDLFEDWRGLVSKAHDGKGNYRLVLSKVFEDADEAMLVADEVMG